MPPFLLTLIGSLLSNNLPQVAQAVVNKGLGYVEDKLGIKIDPTGDGNLTPDQITSIRLAAIKHEEFQVEQDNKNTADARDLQKVALQQADILSKQFVYYLATFWSLFSAAYIYLITFYSIPATSVRYSDTILGFLLGTVVSLVLNYFFGSSSGSAAKTQQLMQVQDVISKNGIGNGSK